MKSISVMGCGWLGLPLAKELVGKYNIKGSTTSEEKLKSIKKLGADPFDIKLTENGIEGDIQSFLASDILILNIPPGSVSAEQNEYRELIELTDQSPISKLLFVSSTSIYPNYCGEVTEGMKLTPATALNSKLCEMETELNNMTNTDSTIVRFGGLIGYERHPGEFFAGRRNVSDPFAPVNLIHRDDCIGIIKKILDKNIWGEAFNCCADTHPTKKEFYTEAAKSIGLELPTFERSDKEGYKIINNRKTREVLDYNFSVPDLIEFVRKGN